MTVMHIDVSGIVRAIARVAPSQADMRNGLRALTIAARTEWIRAAGEDLSSTSRDYIQGIQDPTYGSKGPNTSAIALLGVLPNMIERGWPRTDLRTTVLRSPRAKRSKAGGKYMAIPFRHGTPGTTGRNVGPAMPGAIHSAAKRLLPAIPKQPGGSLYVRGERLMAGPGAGRKASAILQRKERPWHAMSIYKGMERRMMASASGKASTPQYRTFRTISENVRSGKDHWIHPGIKARRIHRRVQTFVKEIAAVTFANAMR